MKSVEIEYRLTHGLDAPFGYRKYVVVPNVSWGMLPYEADLLALNKNGYLHEVEIKISLADLKRDLLKKKHLKRHRLVKALTYAMPLDVWEKVKDNPPIPEHAGVICIHPVQYYSRPRLAKANPDACALSMEEQFKFARLGAMRYWTRMACPDLEPVYTATKELV